MKWACAACTFLNQPNDTKCSMCSERYIAPTRIHWPTSTRARAHTHKHTHTHTSTTISTITHTHSHRHVHVHTHTHTPHTHKHTHTCTSSGSRTMPLGSTTTGVNYNTEVGANPWIFHSCFLLYVGAGNDGGNGGDWGDDSDGDGWGEGGNDDWGELTNAADDPEAPSSPPPPRLHFCP